ncbi:MAG: hypothetical protein Q4A16_03835 [Lautropia sp.]|nr:hypothetical protein [Lautropia sp.]
MKKAIWLALGLALLTSPVQARIHKCTVGGQVAFQEMPCAADSGMTEVKSSTAGSQEYPWSGLRAGMSVEEVRSMVPGATEPGKRGGLANGAVARLERPVSISGVSFVATYYFLNGRYYQVNIGRADGIYANAEVQSDYEKVEPVMLRAFGKPARQVRLEQTSMQLKGRMEWAGAGNQRIWLSITPVSSSRSMMTFGHRPAGAPAFKALPR